MFKKASWLSESELRGSSSNGSDLKFFVAGEILSSGSESHESCDVSIFHLRLRLLKQETDSGSASEFRVHSKISLFWSGYIKQVLISFLVILTKKIDLTCRHECGYLRCPPCVSFKNDTTR